ncbi:MAG: isochorismatase family protein [Candidatus Sungbacteria bacterium]|nr:isochorismatase family protein [bacterium]MDZ4260547.1 isochorismatase family protein [Candidatus Sungbacteria bacterium]
MSAQLLEMLKREMPIRISEISLRMIRMSRTGLILVDLVNGFCTVGMGNLAPKKFDASIADMVDTNVRLARLFALRGRPIWVFRDEHDPAIPEPPYPPHCIKGSGEELLVPELMWLNEYPKATVTGKRCINGFIGAISDQGNLLIDWVNRHRLVYLVVAGICTDICDADLVCSLLSARNHQMMPSLKDVIVYVPGTATYNLTREEALSSGLPEYAAHPADVTAYMGLYTMASRGAILIYD